MADAVRKGLSGASLLMGVQVVSRLASFVLNLTIARHVDPAEFGVSSIQFHLVLNSVLFLTREGFRRVCLRNDISHSEKAVAHTVNLAWLSVPVGAAVSVAVCALCLNSHAKPGSDTAAIAHYREGVLLTALAAMVELCSEPVFVVWQNLLLFGPRTGVEITAMSLRCVMTFVLVKLRWGVLAFAAAQLLYAVALAVGFYGYTIVLITQARARRDSQKKRDDGDGDGAANFPLCSLRSLLPRTHIGKARLEHLVGEEQVHLAGTFMFQTLWKFFLAEGEKMVLVATMGLHDQGAFGLVSNLGSLVVRFVFQPLEETSHTLFSKLAFDTAPSPKERSAKKEQMLGLLVVVVSAMTMLGLLFVCFGPNYSFTLVHLLYSEKWSSTDAPTLLAVYCLYVLLMAVNGVTEAFVHAVATKEQLKTLNVVLVVISVTHLAVMGVATHSLGSMGILVANCLNMALRIAQSAYFIATYFRSVPGMGLSRFLPSIGTGVACVASAAVTAATSARWERTGQWIVHVGVGALCGMATLAFVVWRDGKLIAELQSLRRQARQ